MAIFRVEKTKDFTIMSNHHLRNVNLSLKAKGLMSLMLSLPDDWDYTLKGLSYICKDGVDSISGALKELEEQGYLTRQRIRLSNGRLGDVEYTLHEEPENPLTEPISPKREKPDQGNPNLANPVLAQPTLEKPAQSNTKELNTNESIDERDKTRVRAYRKLIMENIEYDTLAERYGSERINAVVELMLEVVVSDYPFCVISSEKLPREVVRSRFLKINSSHIEFIFEELDKVTGKVKNTRAYILSALFNAPVTMDTHYRLEVNHDYPVRQRRMAHE